MYVIPGSVRKMGAREEAALGAYSVELSCQAEVCKICMFGVKDKLTCSADCDFCWRAFSIHLFFGFRRLL